MSEQELEKMKAIISHLEDLSNLQQTLIEKISKVELEIEDAPNETLKSALEDAHSNTAGNMELIKNTIEEYTMRYNALSME